MSVKKMHYIKGSPGLQAVVLSKVMVNNSNQKFLFLIFILMKLGEVVVPMDTTTSPSFIKIGLKTKKFSHESISGTLNVVLITVL